MGLKMKRITGLVYAPDQIDRFLCSRGFVRRNGQPPVYDLRIRDHISGEEFRLRIPTTYHRTKNQPTIHLKLGQPVLHRLSGGRRDGLIPDHIREATEHKIAEIFSYLYSVHS